MARITFKAGEDWALRLSGLATRSEDVAKKALYEGAKIVADKMRGNLSAMPTEKYRYLQSGEQFSGLSQSQKDDLLSGFGITPIRYEGGVWNVKIGFDGYGSYPTQKYPNGVPNQLLARAVESGSSVRRKHPFVRPAVNATRKQAVDAMQRAIDEECEKIMKG